MFGLLACLCVPPFFVAWAVRLSPEGSIEIRYPLRRRHIDVETVRSIELTFGFPHRLKIRFLRGRLLWMRDNSPALELARAVVRMNPSIEVVGFDEAFDF